MARSLFRASSDRSFTSTMLHIGLLQLMMVVMGLAQRCTRAVPVHEYPAVKKTHVLRRIPAACSNWDKAWAWLTKVDCGTKYRLDYVTVPSMEVRQYKLQYVCCDGGTDCEEGENKSDNIHSSGFDSTDEKFLAIILGSSAACIVIIIIVLAITFYTRKTRCYTSCDQEGHVYASADREDSQDGNGDTLKSQPEDFESEAEHKGNEVEYAEINDPRLPRYTDIFKDSIGDREDPFNRASAPPMYSAVAPKSYVNSEVGIVSSLHSRNGTEMAGPLPSNFKEEASAVCQNAQIIAAGQHDMDDDEEGTLYYNVGEKIRRKKRISSYPGGTATKNKVEVRIKRDPAATKSRTHSNNRKSKTNVPVVVEMIVKSSSASESIEKYSETALNKQKRRSAPPSTADLGILPRYQTNNSYSVCNVSASGSSSTCSVINEVIQESHSLGDPNRKQKSTKISSEQKYRRKTNQEHMSDNSGVKSLPNSKTNAKTTTTDDITNTSGSIPPTGTVVLTSCDSLGITPTEYESKENDSLLRTSLCHSDCMASEECEHCSKYDRLKSIPDPETASLHIYQCLDEVRLECQKLRENTSKACSEVPPTTSKTEQKTKNSISRGKDHVQLVSNSSKRKKAEYC